MNSNKYFRRSDLGSAMHKNSIFIGKFMYNFSAFPKSRNSFLFVNEEERLKQGRFYIGYERS